MIKRKFKNEYMTKKRFVETWLKIHAIAKKSGMYSNDGDKTDYETFMEVAKAENSKEKVSSDTIGSRKASTKRKVKSLDFIESKVVKSMLGSKALDSLVEVKSSVSKSEQSKSKNVSLEEESAVKDVASITSVTSELKKLNLEEETAVDSFEVKKLVLQSVKGSSKKRSSSDNSITLKEENVLIENTGKDFPEKNTSDVFDIEIPCSSLDSEFNGVQLLEKEIKDGVMQIGFYAGEFEITSKKVKKRKAKVIEENSVEEQSTQISFV